MPDAASPSTKSVPQKLLIRAGYRALVLNAPDDAERLLSPLPEGVEVVPQPTGGADFDVVLAFVRSKEDVAQHAASIIAGVKPGGLLWMAYPKKSGAIKTDISRDDGWQPMWVLGWDTVSLVALDDTWSAMRFRPLSQTKHESAGRAARRSS